MTQGFPRCSRTLRESLVRLPRAWGETPPQVRPTSPSGFSGPPRPRGGRTHGTEVPQSVSDLSPALRSRITAPIMGFYLASSDGDAGSPGFHKVVPVYLCTPTINHHRHPPPSSPVPALAPPSVPLVSSGVFLLCKCLLGLCVGSAAKAPKSDRKWPLCTLYSYNQSPPPIPLPCPPCSPQVPLGVFCRQWGVGLQDWINSVLCVERKCYRLSGFLHL